MFLSTWRYEDMELMLSCDVIFCIAKTFNGTCCRFIESEVELNEVIQELQVIATVPDYYSILTELNTIQSLLHLLSHDNTDISIAVVDLIQVSALLNWWLCFVMD